MQTYSYSYKHTHIYRSAYDRTTVLAESLRSWGRFDKKGIRKKI